MAEKIKIHIHDNSKVPAGQNCLGEFKLERDKVITLHMHDGPCQLCPEGHCHHGSIGIVLMSRLRIRIPAGCTKGQASYLIDEKKARAA